MTQSRRPAGTPVGGQFAPTNRPRAGDLGLTDGEAAAPNRPVAVSLAVDWEQLRAQKARLVELADSRSELGGDADLDGIIALLDAIQDQAAEVIGEQAVFGDLEASDSADDGPSATKRVDVDVATGIPSFSIEGTDGRSTREIRDRVRAAMLSSGLAWPMGRVVVRLESNGFARHGELDLEVALGLLKKSGQLPDDVEVGHLRGELGLDGSIRGDATTDARSLGELVAELKAGSQAAARAGVQPTSKTPANPASLAETPANPASLAEALETENQAWSWTSLTAEVGKERAEDLFKRSGGSLGAALASANRTPDPERGGATPNEVADANAAGVQTGDYIYARRASVAHDEVLEAHRFGISIPGYADARRLRATHDEVLEAHRSGVGVRGYISGRWLGYSHREVLEARGIAPTQAPREES